MSPQHVSCNSFAEFKAAVMITSTGFLNSLCLLFARISQLSAFGGNLACREHPPQRFPPQPCKCSDLVQTHVEGWTYFAGPLRRVKTFVDSSLAYRGKREGTQAQSHLHRKLAGQIESFFISLLGFLSPGSDGFRCGLVKGGSG